MELRVRDVVANKRYKGTTQRQINTMHNGHGCKETFGVGNGNCGSQNCDECFDTLISKLEERDKKAYEYDEGFDDDD